MAAQLDLVRAEREQSVRGNEALGAPPAGALDRLMASLPAARPGVAQRIARSTLLQQVADLFAAPTARSVQWAALAAAALIVVQAAAISTLLVRGGGTYQTAPARRPARAWSRSWCLPMTPGPAPSPSCLAEFEASIVDGPKPGGVYKIRLRTSDRSQAAQDTVLRRLAERRDIVTTVLPSRD